MKEEKVNSKFSFKKLSRLQKILAIAAVLLVIAVMAVVLYNANNKPLSALWYRETVKDFGRIEYQTLGLTKVEESTDPVIMDYKYNDDNNIAIYCSYYIDGDRFAVRVIAQDQQEAGYQLDGTTIKFYLLRDGKVVNMYNNLGFGQNISTVDDPSLYAFENYFEFDMSDNYAHEYTVEIFNFAEQMKYVCDLGLI